MVTHGRCIPKQTAFVSAEAAGVEESCFGASECPSPPYKVLQVTQSGPSGTVRRSPPERHSGHKSL